MIDLSLVEMILYMVEVVFTSIIVVFTARKMIGRKNSYLPAFFTFAMVSYLLSTLYWIAFTILRPDTRMPFAADEIAECAMLLLLSAGIVADKKAERKFVLTEVIYTALFCAANISLWICWSGEWVQDIIFGLPYAYFLWLIIRGLSDTKAISKTERVIVRTACCLMVVSQFLILIASEQYQVVLDICGYILMLGMLLWLLIKSLKCRNLFLSYAFFLGTMFVSFACSDIFYCIATVFQIAALPIMYLTMKNELNRGDKN